MLPLSQRNTTQQRHSLSSNFYFRFSFVIALLFVFSACTKSVQEKAVEPIQAEEIVNWFKEYKQKLVTTDGINQLLDVFTEIEQVYADYVFQE